MALNVKPSPMYNKMEDIIYSCFGFNAIAPSPLQSLLQTSCPYWHSIIEPLVFMCYILSF